MEEMKKYLEEQIESVRKEMGEAKNKAYEYAKKDYNYEYAQEYFNKYALEAAKLDVLEEVLDKLEDIY